jgi:hypothetical protein
MYIIMLRGNFDNYFYNYLCENHNRTWDLNLAKQFHTSFEALSYYWQYCKNTNQAIDYKIEPIKVSISIGTMPIAQAKDAFRELYTIALHPDRESFDELNTKQELYGYDIHIDYITRLLQDLGLSNGTWFHVNQIVNNFWQCGYPFELLELLIEADSYDYECTFIDNEFNGKYIRFTQHERLRWNLPYVKNKLKIVSK